MEDLLTGLIRNIAGGAPAATTTPSAPATDPLHDFLSRFHQKAQTNQEALLNKSPFLANLRQEGTRLARNVGAAGDQVLAETGANVRDFLTGKLKPSAGDWGEGAWKTIKGVGKIAQAFNEGVVQLARSGAEAVVGQENSNKVFENPTVQAFLADAAGNPDTPTLQKIYDKGVKHALDLGATPNESKIFGGSLAIGMGLLDNPFFGEGKALTLADDTVRAISKTDDVAKIAGHLEAGGVPADVAAKIAPAFKTADSPKLVRTVAQELSRGVKDAAEVAATGDLSKERGFVTSVRERIPELETRVAGQYIPRSTDRLSIEAADLVRTDVAAAEKLVAQGTDDKAVATAVQLIKTYTDEARAAANDATKNAMFDNAARVANDIAVKLTEQGRAVQAASILSRLTPEGQVRFAARQIQKFNEMNPTRKIPELTGEQTQIITEKMQKAAEMPDGRDKAKAFFEAEEYIAKLVPSPLYKKFIAVWKAGLLTGIKTSGINISSNLMHGVSEFVKDVPAAAVDSLASLVTGKRTLALTAKGSLKGGSEGMRKGWDYFKTGFDERYAREKIDLHKVHFGDSPVAKSIQAYEETVFRAIGAEDQPFYYAAKARSLYSQAIAEAKNQKLKPGEAKDFIEKTVANPTDEMLVNATHDAEVAVFQNNTALGTAARAIQQNVPGGEIIVPFGRTPAAVATQMFHYTPVGTVAEILKQVKQGHFSQRAFSQAVGRGVTGTGALYLGYQLWKQGKVALGYPTDPTTQQEWTNEGKQENSILINGKWRQIGVLGPIGTELVIGGYLADAYEKSGSVVNAIANASVGGLTTLTQSTFLSGLTQFTDALKDPQKSAGTLFKGLIASLVPTIVGDVARGTDSLERDTTLSGGYLDRAKAKIPGLRETLPAKTDTLGHKIATPDWFTVFADPSRPTTSHLNDPVVAELARLSDAGQKATMNIPGDRKGFGSLTADQNVKLRQRAGQILKGKLNTLIKDDRYAAMDDEKKKDTIQKFNKSASDTARAEMAVELTQGLSGGQLLAKLKELRSGGLLTQDVFHIYQQIR